MAKAAEQDKPPTLKGAAVVLDTNALDQTGLLKDPVTVAMLFYLGQLEGHLALPEVIRSEWSEHWREHMRKQYKSFNQLRDWLDGHLEGVPEFETDIAVSAVESFEHRLDELGDLLLEEPIADTDWREAGEMVVEKRPPTTEGSQQFKDSLLWRALLRLGQQQIVVLVSADKGFQGDTESGLAATLAREADDLNADVRLVKSRVELLEQLKDQSDSFVTNLEDMWLDVEDPFIEEVDYELFSEGFSVGASCQWETEVFATGDPKKVVVTLELESELEDVNNPGGDMPVLVHAKGSALVNIENWDTEVALDSLSYRMLTPHGDIEREILTSGAPPRRRVLTKLDLASISF